MQNRVVILDALRIPTGKQKGYYKKTIPEDFASFLLEHLVIKNPNLKNELSNFILGCSLGTGGNMARYALLNAGFKVDVPAYTIDAQCVSSFLSIQNATALLKSGMSDFIVAGGIESSSLKPQRKYSSNDPRFSDLGYEYASFVPSNFQESSLTTSAEKIAVQFNLTKNELIDWTIRSNERAQKSIDSGFFNEFVIPYQNRTYDETIIKSPVFERFRFKNKENLIDASTSCGYSDGAALLLMSREDLVSEIDRKNSISLIHSVTIGVQPSKTPLAFLSALDKLLIEIGKKVEDIDLFEINESFSLKPVLFSKLYNVSAEKINVFGGNLAIGHPFGASGAINTGNLFWALKKMKKRFGIVAASAAGGIGSALLLENKSV